MGQLAAVTGTSVRVLMADPLATVLHAGCLGGMLFMGCLPTISNTEHTRILRDQCLSFLFLAVCLFLAFGAVRTVTDDLRRGAGDVLASRPLPNWVLLSGKLLALLAVAGLIFGSGAAAYLCASEFASDPEHLDPAGVRLLAALPLLALLLAGLRSWLLRRPFAVVAGILMNLSVLACLGVRLLVGVRDNFDWAALPALALLALGACAFAACALLAATLFDSFLALGACLAVFFLGLVADESLKQLVSSPELRAALLAPLPDWRLFWALDDLGEGLDPRVRLLPAFLQATLMSLLSLSLASLVLDRRDIHGAP
jgi:hypothetical protein